MTNDIIQDRGRGPEVTGTRITVYSLLQSFLDPTMTEAEIGRIYDLTAQQVAAARAYVLGNADTVLAEYLKIEDRLAAGNPPEVREKAERANAALQSFKKWLAEQKADHGQDGAGQEGTPALPTFREWLATREAR